VHFLEARHQIGKLQKVHHAHECAGPTEDYLGIWCHNVRPARWQRANGLVVYTQ
jgi:hypothetical protein